MKPAELVTLEAKNHLALRGDLTQDNAMALLVQLTASIESTAQLSLDLSGLDNLDSAGLALLCQWLKLARAASCNVTFANASERVLSFAELYDLKDLLPFSN